MHNLEIILDLNPHLKKSKGKACTVSIVQLHTASTGTNAGLLPGSAGGPRGVKNFVLPDVLRRAQTQQLRDICSDAGRTEHVDKCLRDERTMSARHLTEHWHKPTAAGLLKEV